MIMTNCLGHPISDASIVCVKTDTVKAYNSICGDYIIPAETYWYVAAVVSLQVKERYNNLESCILDMQALGYTVTRKIDGHGNPCADCVHTETAQKIQKEKEKNDKLFAEAEDGYIRFGAPPKSGHSYNHRDNCDEAGISVFRARFAGKKYQLNINHVELASYYAVSNRPAYRIWGDIVGTGADGEPVLIVTKIQRL